MNKVVMIYKKGGRLFGYAMKTELDEVEIFRRLTGIFDVEELRIIKV